MNARKILLVDDDPDDRLIFKDAFDLLKSDAQILMVQNGEEALDLLNESDSQSAILPTLIVLDLNMPRMNGTETLKNLKQNFRLNKIPVVIYSTSVNPREKAKCMELGAHAYVTKPISLKESLETAKYFLDVSK